MASKTNMITSWVSRILVLGFLVVAFFRFEMVDSELVNLMKETKLLGSMLDGSHDRDVILLKIMYMRDGVDLEKAKVIANAVHDNCVKHKRDADLVLAIISVESHFDSGVTSSMGAIGLMQIMPYWGNKLGIPGDMRDPFVNIEYGLRLLDIYEQMYGKLEIVLTAYNRGPGPVDFALINKQDPANAYAKGVIAKYDHLRTLSLVE